MCELFAESLTKRIKKILEDDEVCRYSLIHMYDTPCILCSVECKRNELSDMLYDAIMKLDSYDILIVLEHLHKVFNIDCFEIDVDDEDLHHTCAQLFDKKYNGRVTFKLLDDKYDLINVMQDIDAGLGEVSLFVETNGIIEKLIGAFNKWNN